VVVADTGPGFPADFRRYQAAEVFYSTKPGHRGLGLAVVYGILRAHRGGLLIEPGPQGGSRVRVVFPQAAAAPVEAAAPPPRPAAAVPREKILVGEDDPLTRELVCTTLTRGGYQVTSASGGPQALDCYRAAGPDPFRLVLSDVIMPAMNGLDLARQLMAEDPQVQVLFVTGQTQGQPVEKDSVQQFDWLTKPFRPDGLLRAVRTALDRVAPRTPPPTRPRVGA
jgi:CheY-like chemotaxis protein